MKKIIFTLAFLTQAFALASTGEGGPIFNHGPSYGYAPTHGYPNDGQIVLQCDGITIYYGSSRSPMIPPTLFSSVSGSTPVESTYIGSDDVYENAYFRLQYPMSVRNEGPRAEFEATLTISGSTPSTVICHKGAKF